jgi:ankyrin repeat protein
LIEHSVDVGFPGERYGNALQAACANGHEQIARLLVDAKADVNVKGEHCHALFAAIHDKNDATVKLLQESGAIPPVEMLRRKLFAAVQRGYTPGIAVLLGFGADITSMDSF